MDSSPRFLLTASADKVTTRAFMQQEDDDDEGRRARLTATQMRERLGAREREEADDTEEVMQTRGPRSPPTSVSLLSLHATELGSGRLRRKPTRRLGAVGDVLAASVQAESP